MKSSVFLVGLLFNGFAFTVGILFGPDPTAPPCSTLTLTCPSPCTPGVGPDGCRTCDCNTTPSTQACQRVFTRSGEISSYVQSDSCVYLLDLGEGHEKGLKFVRLQFLEMNLKECDGCGCDYIQLENSNFQQRVCGGRDAVLGRTYKVETSNKTDRYVRLTFHKDSALSSSGFRLKYEIDWGNASNVCQPVTCPTRCPLGLQQDFVNCPMCKCASTLGRTDTSLLDSLSSIANKVNAVDSEISAIKIHLQSIHNYVAHRQGGDNTTVVPVM